MLIINKNIDKYHKWELFHQKKTLNLWTNNEFNDFSLSACSHEEENNDPQRELIIATDMNANFTNKIGEIVEAVDVNKNILQQYNWQNLLKEWVFHSNAIPNNNKTQILREIDNGRVAIHPSYKHQEIQNKTGEYQNQSNRKTSKTPSLKYRICNLSFTNASTKRIHQEFHNTR